MKKNMNFNFKESQNSNKQFLFLFKFFSFLKFQFYFNISLIFKEKLLVCNEKHETYSKLNYFIMSYIFIIKNMLSGTKILDLSRIIVGPYATMILSDFGCQVIKVQSIQGDPTRQWGPPWHAGTSAYFLSVNRNKRSIALDFHKATHRQILYKLTQKSDAVVQNFIPGTTEKLQIDYQSLKKYNQKLVYCSISGYGDVGKMAHLPAFDHAIQAEAGFMHLTGSPQTDPFKLGFAITDVVTGLYASNAILAGLLHRNRTNKGIHLKTSLYECAVSALINQGSNYLNGGISPQRIGNHHPNIIPYGLYKTKDGSIIICIGTEGQYDRLKQLLNLPQIHQFSSNSARIKNRANFDRQLTSRLQEYTADQIIQKFRQFSIPCAKVNSLKDTLQSPLAQELKIVRQVDECKFVRSPIRTDKQNCIAEPSKVPNLNQNCIEILEQIGMSSEQIKQWLKNDK